MTNGGIATLDHLCHLVDEGIAQFEVRQTESGERVELTTDDDRYDLEGVEHDLFLELFETYRDLFIDLHDINNERTGSRRLWHFGSAITVHASRRGLDEPVYEEIEVFARQFDLDAQRLRYAVCVHEIFDDPTELPVGSDISAIDVGKACVKAEDKEGVFEEIDTS